MSRIAKLSLILLLAAGLSACGKRGPLEPPPGQTNARETAKSDAKAKAAAPQTSAGQMGEPVDPTSEPGRTRLGGKKRVPITPPKRDLIIDKILD